RHTQPGPTVTRRAHAGEGYGVKHLEWLLRWHQALWRPDHIEMLLGCRPIARPENKLVITHKLREGAYRPEEFRLEIPGPFALSLRCEDWLAALAPSCDGQVTWRQHFHNAKRSNIIREDLAIEEFAKGL